MNWQSPYIDWSRLKHFKIIFGQQSVGQNIIDGIQTLMKRDNQTLSVNEGKLQSNTNGIMHFRIGKNRDPISKIREFENMFESANLDGVSIAFMKFCYIDIDANTNVQEIADAYIESLERLKLNHPRTYFVATTVPLKAVQSGLKAWTKILLGRQPHEYEENFRRGEFNSLVRRHYKEQGSLFDLAKTEATSTGSHTTVTVHGREVEVLANTLTHDGGHLNSLGQIRVAEQLLHFLSTLPRLEEYQL